MRNQILTTAAYSRNVNFTVMVGNKRDAIFVMQEPAGMHHGKVSVKRVDPNPEDYNQFGEITNWQAIKLAKIEAFNDAVSKAMAIFTELITTPNVLG